MLSIEQDRCIECEACIEGCFKHALTVEDGVIRHDPEKCIWCGHCLALCPRDCIIIDGDGYNCEDVEEIGLGNRPGIGQIRNMMLVRRSIRYFTEDPVTEDELGFILEAGKYSPTGMNRQGNAFVVVTADKVPELADDTIEAFRRMLDSQCEDEKYTEIAGKLCAKYDEDHIDEIYYSAPLVVFVFADTDVDGAICAANMGWIAQAQQLGYCFARIPTRAFADPEFAEKWQAPAGKKCVIALMIGNPVLEYFSSVPRKDPQVVIF